MSDKKLETITEEVKLRKCTIARCEEMIPESYPYKRCDACRLSQTASTSKYRLNHRDKYNEYGRRHALKHYYKTVEERKKKEAEALASE
jgi:hypothetical protein